MFSKKEGSENKKKSRIFWILGILLAFLIGKFFGPAVDQVFVGFQNWIHETRYADGLIYVELDEEVYGEGGKSEDKAVVAYFDTELHLDQLYVGQTMKTTIEVGNGSYHSTRLLFETEGPVKVEIDEDKAEGSEVIIPPHTKAKIPVVITAPNETFKKPVLTYVKLNQEAITEEKNGAQKLLPGANIPIYIPNIAPPLKPLALLSEVEFNALDKEQRELYELENGVTYADIDKSGIAKTSAYVSYQYDSLMFYSYGYLKYVLIALGVVILLILLYQITRKVGKKKNEKIILEETIL